MERRAAHFTGRTRRRGQCPRFAYRHARRQLAATRNHIVGVLAVHRTHIGAVAVDQREIVVAQPHRLRHAVERRFQEIAFAAQVPGFLGEGVDRRDAFGHIADPHDVSQRVALIVGRTQAPRLDAALGRGVEEGDLEPVAVAAQQIHSLAQGILGRFIEAFDHVIEVGL